MSNNLLNHSRALFLGFLFAVAILILQGFAIGLSEGLVSKAVFTPFTEGSDHYQTQAFIMNLDPGDYYISVGRPRGHCDLLADDRLLSSTRSSETAYRSSLLLGSALHIGGENRPKIISVRCQKYSGYSVNLTGVSPIASVCPRLACPPSLS